MTLNAHVCLSFCFYFRTTNYIQHSDAAGFTRRERTNQVFHSKYASTRPHCESVYVSYLSFLSNTVYCIVFVQVPFKAHKGILNMQIVYIYFCIVA